MTLQRDDMSMANLIASGLFGDGAAAVGVAGSDCGWRGPKILDTRSVFYPDTEEMMGWDVLEKGFHIVLSPEVPDLVRRQVANDVDSFFGRSGTQPERRGELDHA